MSYYTLVDKVFKRHDEEVHPLEQAARECMKEAQNARNAFLAMIAESCAIRIRMLPGWRMYRKKGELE